jgi:hypothetical protein
MVAADDLTADEMVFRNAGVDCGGNVTALNRESAL